MLAMNGPNHRNATPSTYSGYQFTDISVFVRFPIPSDQLRTTSTCILYSSPVRIFNPSAMNPLMKSAGQFSHNVSGDMLTRTFKGILVTISALSGYDIISQATSSNFSGSISGVMPITVRAVLPPDLMNIWSKCIPMTLIHSIAYAMTDE